MPAEALVLDANLLVLLIVGTTSEAYISRHKRLRAFTVNDFRLLTTRLSAAAQVWVTPNTVTEASNLAGQINEPARTHIFAVFRGLLRKLREFYVPSLHASEQKAILRLGVTDAGLLLADFADHVLMTVDLDLYLEAGRLKRKAINFNHYIEANRTTG